MIASAVERSSHIEQCVPLLHTALAVCCMALQCSDIAVDAALVVPCIYMAQAGCASRASPIHGRVASSSAMTSVGSRRRWNMGRDGDPAAVQCEAV